MDLDDIEVREESHDHAAPCARPSCLAPQNPPQVARVHPPASTTAKNRRRRYLDTHPEYFGSNLELSGIQNGAILHSPRGGSPRSSLMISNASCR